MIADLKPYPEYRESGLLWLGKLPINWSQRKLLTLSTLRVERNPGNLQLLSVFLNRGVIPYNEGGGQVHAPSLDLSKYQVVYPGDFVLNNQQAWRGSVGVSRYHGIISPAYIVLRLSSTLNSEYTNYLMQSAVMVDQFVTASKGVGDIQRTIYWPYLKTAQVPLPPPDEQAAIVRFLNHTNQRIERTIRAKRKVIALLNEQKQVIIHRAVTRGLDQNVRLKPSGIQGVDGIPEHWNVRRLRSLVHRIDQGVSPQAVGFLAVNNSWGVLKSGCVNRGFFRETEHKRLAKSFIIDPSIVVKVGDVLISRACGSPQLVGSVGKIKELNYKLILSDKIFRPVFKDTIDVDFTVYAMNSRYYRIQVDQAISGAEGLANNLPLSSLRDFTLAVPPREEAQKISRILRDMLCQLETTISCTEREIDLLREYRTRLIADVVTGKLDVREVAARLPDEVEEIEDAILDDDDVTGEEVEA